MHVVVKAYGKINLFLDCIGKREDGYHEVSMIMQSVRLHDLVDISEAATNSVYTDSMYVPNNRNNLAMRAALLLQEKNDMPQVAIKIKKNIPVSAGMAGGSSDAAAVLVGCNILFNLGLSELELMDIAANIGSDVPFCIKGGTAIAEGRGEKIRPISALPTMHVLLVRADYGVSTAAVYKEIKPLDLHPQKALFSQLCDAIYAGNTNFVENHLYNALEQPSFRVDSRTKERKQILLDCGVKHVLMSGSGPTLFALYATEHAAWENYKKIRAIFPNVYLTSTCSSDLIKDRVIF
ncbi:MAG: 4-(cytidine 5'-diphospho)-2-C-methyl-D-erythritol kinase [Peptococcaceae bacterium]|nr:4-(cytidine 5'-diphospho)-2-C-methyl-D-erythritol kinase [Peptococcaceae bacterium]